MDFPDHPFWNFSLAVHGTPGVHEACLALQTGYGLDVNILFFCCYAACAKGARLDEQQIEDAANSVSGWQEEIVRLIWKARWRLKPSFGAFPIDQTEELRRKLIEAELDAEHMEQLHLAGSVPVEGDPHLPEELRIGYALANLFAYLDRFPLSGPAPGGQDLAGPLTVLLSACFPAADKESLASSIARLLRAP